MRKLLLLSFFFVSTYTLFAESKKILFIERTSDVERSEDHSSSVHESFWETLEDGNQMIFIRAELDAETEIKTQKTLFFRSVRDVANENRSEVVIYYTASPKVLKNSGGWWIAMCDFRFDILDGSGSYLVRNLSTKVSAESALREIAIRKCYRDLRQLVQQKINQLESEGFINENPNRMKLYLCSTNPRVFDAIKECGKTLNIFSDFKAIRHDPAEVGLNWKVFEFEKPGYLETEHVVSKIRSYISHVMESEELKGELLEDVAEFYDSLLQKESSFGANWIEL